MFDKKKPGRDAEHDDAADVHDAEGKRHTRAGWAQQQSDPEKSKLNTRDAEVDRDAADVDRDRARLERKREPDESS
jgi:hypothetical protein